MPTHQDQHATYKYPEPSCQHTRINTPNRTNMPTLRTSMHIHWDQHAYTPGPTCQHNRINMPTEDQHANTQGSTRRQRTNMPTKQDQHADRRPTCQQNRINTPTKDQHADTDNSGKCWSCHLVDFKKKYFFDARDQHAAGINTQDQRTNIADRLFLTSHVGPSLSACWSWCFGMLVFGAACWSFLEIYIYI